MKRRRQLKDWVILALKALRVRIILPIAVVSRFMDYIPKRFLNGINPETKASANASTEQFLPLR
ncbi:hypothetical protein [Paenibacillus sp. FSL E2-0201]|uniref:hypothetical protein n=1 Tax=Paenibacillus sp. FSL E2-0201 TaxID=2954726 RepID=UPI0030DBC5E2